MGTLSFKMVSNVKTFHVKGISGHIELRGAGRQEWYSSILRAYGTASKFSGVYLNLLFIEHCLFLKIDVYYLI